MSGPEPVEDIYEARAVILAQHNQINALLGQLSISRIVQETKVLKARNKLLEERIKLIDIITQRDYGVLAIADAISYHFEMKALEEESRRTEPCG
jgi:hypothetical protein